MRIATTLVLDMPVGCYYIYTPHLALSANVYLFKRRGLPLGRTSVSLHFPSLFLFLFTAPSLTLFSSFQESTTRSTPGNNAEIDQLFFTIHRESAGDRWGGETLLFSRWRALQPPLCIGYCIRRSYFSRKSIRDEG